MTRFAAPCAALLAAIAVPVTLAAAQTTPQPAPAGSAVQVPAPKLTDAQMAKGRQLFQDNSCGGCHTLADGGGSGSIGPSLDGNARVDHALVVDRVTNGSGPMPGFGASLSKDDIELIASYVVQAKK